MPIVQEGRYAPPVHMIKLTETLQISTHPTKTLATALADIFFWFKPLSRRCGRAHGKMPMRPTKANVFGESGICTFNRLGAIATRSQLAGSRLRQGAPA
jgi:hypothetical protein